MPRFVSIAKASFLTGVTANEIQNKIDNQQLTSTRGQIHIDDLIECYPKIQIEDTDILSLVAKIKEESFATAVAKQHGEMTFESMQQELRKLKANADYHQERSQKYEEIILYIRDNLEELQHKIGKSQRIEGLINWMEQRLGELRRND